MSANQEGRPQSMEDVVKGMFAEMGIRRINPGDGPFNMRMSWGISRNYEGHALFVITDAEHARSRAGHHWMSGRLRKGDFLLKDQIAGDHFYTFKILRLTPQGELRMMDGIEACGYEGMGEKVMNLGERQYHRLMAGMPVPLADLGLEQFAMQTAAVPAAAAFKPEKARMGGLYSIKNSDTANAKLAGTNLEGIIQRGDLLLCFGNNAGLNHYAMAEVGKHRIVINDRAPQVSAPYRIGGLVHTFTAKETGQILSDDHGFNIDPVLARKNFRNRPNDHTKGHSFAPE